MTFVEAQELASRNRTGQSRVSQGSGVKASHFKTGRRRAPIVDLAMTQNVASQERNENSGDLRDRVVNEHRTGHNRAPMPATHEVRSKDRRSENHGSKGRMIERRVPTLRLARMWRGVSGKRTAEGGVRRDRVVKKAGFRTGCRRVPMLIVVRTLNLASKETSRQRRAHSGAFLKT